MANKIYTGNAANVPQITTSTMSGTFLAGENVWCEINKKRLTATLASSVALSDVANTLRLMIMAANKTDDLHDDEVRTYGGREFGEYHDVQATSSGAVLTLTSTKMRDGTYWPHTVTFGTNSAAGTVGAAVITQNSTGSSYLDNADNYQGGTAVAQDDDLYLPEGNFSIQHNINNSLTGISLYKRNDHHGSIGLPEVNKTWGTGLHYDEYRPTRLTLPSQALSAQIIEIGDRWNQNEVRGTVRLDMGAGTAGTYLVFNLNKTEPYTQQKGAAVDIVGGTGTVSLGCYDASVRIGGKVGDNNTEINGVTIDGKTAHVTIADTVTGASSQTTQVYGGMLIDNSKCTGRTYKVYDGGGLVLTKEGGSVTLLELFGGNTTVSQSTSYAIASMVGHGGAKLKVEFGRFTTATAYAGFEFDDSDNLGTWDDGIEYHGCSIEDVKKKTPKGKKWTMSNI